LQRCSRCGLVATHPAPPQNELPRYYQSEDYISHTGGSNSLIDVAYRWVRNRNIRWKEKVLRQYSPGTSLLDYGCGTGEVIDYCSRNGWQVHGIEPSEKARERAQLHGIPVTAALPPNTSHFSAVSLWHVLEHVPDPAQTLADLMDRLAEDGTIFIAVPNCASADAQHYGSAWAGYDVPRHLWHFRQPVMNELLNNAGLQMISTIPMQWDAFYVSMLSEKYLGHSLAPVRGLWRGWQSNQRAAGTGEYSSLLYIAKR
jgi:2-polyprenyl-3-methyl-5-hydroxy-6-metoxy-1,4-benzoquinol methylase